MIEQQEGKCLICEETKELVVDHCHTTNRVRGLLCHGCNKGLGVFRDNILWFERAITYLKHNSI